MDGIPNSSDSEPLSGSAPEPSSSELTTKLALDLAELIIRYNCVMSNEHSHTLVKMIERIVRRASTAIIAPAESITGKLENLVSIVGKTRARPKADSVIAVPVTLHLAVSISTAVHKLFQ